MAALSLIAIATTLILTMFALWRQGWWRAPVMALFYLAQRHLVAGLTAGAVKG